MNREAPQAYRKPSVPIASEVAPDDSTIGRTPDTTGVSDEDLAAMPRLKR
jgi:hypothetical protein